MKLGVLHTALDCDELDEAFEMASAVGAEGIEVQYTRANRARLHRNNHIDELVELAAKHKLEIPSLCLAFLCDSASLRGTPEEIATAQRVIRRALSVARQAGVGAVVVPFFGKNTINLEAELYRAAEAMIELVEDAENASVTIAVESTLNFDQQDFLLNFLGNTGHVKICCDTGNALARKLDLPGGIRHLGAERIARIHYKDVRLASGSPPNFDVPLGGGDVDFRAVTEALRAVGYDDWIVLETPPGDDAAGSAAANLAFVQELLAR